MNRRQSRHIQKLHQQIATATEPEAPPALAGMDQTAAVPAPETEPAPAEAPMPEAQAEALPEAQDSPEYWRSRFHTMEGILRKEREDQARDQQGQAAQLRQLQGQLSELQGQIDATRDPLAELDLSQHFSEDQIAQYGDDHLRSVLRAAQHTLQPQLQQLLSREMAPLREELAHTRQSVAQARRSEASQAYEGFLGELARQVPEWQQVNEDPRFHAFLEQVDEASGEQRQALLTRFEQRRDAARVARLFGEFLRRSGALPARDPHKRLLPDGSPDGGHPPPDPRPAITQAQIRQFQADVARGRYRGRAQEQAAMQKRIDEAYVANRIG